MEYLKNNIGQSGETIAGYLTALSCNGEAIKKTRFGEGGNSIDFDLEFPSTICVGTHVYLAIQVKTGNSFLSKNAKHFRIDNIHTSHLIKWRKSDTSTVLVIVDPENIFDCYFKFIGKKATSRTIYISFNNKISPSFRFSADRFSKMLVQDNDRLRQITISPCKNLTNARKNAKAKLFSIKGIIDSPIGKVCISNYSLRHMTRTSKQAKKVFDSLLLFPYVNKILVKKPTAMYTLENLVSENGGNTREEKRILLVYKEVKFSDKGLMTLYVRLNEVTEYPKNWTVKGLIESGVSHFLRLESIYRKYRAHPPLR